MITLNDLTTAQVAMCERVWACKEKQDFMLLVAQLTEEDRQMATTLMERYPDAEAMLDRLKKDYL